MAIDSLDGLVKGMGQGMRYPFQKASMSTMVAGHQASLWRATGVPTQAAIPTTAAICAFPLSGSNALPTKAADQHRVLAQLTFQMAFAGSTLLIEDRLMHMGGLLGNSVAIQTANVNLYSNLANNNLAERIGESDYSEVQWFLEWYTATGATVSTPTAQCTFHDGTTGSVNIYAWGATALPASVAAGRRYRINPTNGKYIRSVEAVTLSASTGTAGNFGVTAVRPRAAALCPTASQLTTIDWSMLGAPRIFDQSCITFSQACITTTSGALVGDMLFAVA